MQKQFLILIFQLLSFDLLQSQAPVFSLKVQELMDLFSPSQQGGIWIQHYSGVSGNGDSYILSLGHNGREYRAILQNLTSDETLNAEGNYHFENIKLVLQDSLLEIAGFLFGEVKPNGILIQVLDRRKEKGKYIEFQKMTREGFKVFDCPVQVWYQSFAGIMDRNPVIIQLQKDFDQRIYGSISVPDKLTGYMVSGNCDDVPCEKMDLRVHDFFGERFKEYKSTPLALNQIQVEENYKDKFQIFETWTSQNKYNFKCKNLSFPGLKMYAQYIQIADRDFDNWIESFITKWTEQVVSFYQVGPLREQKQANVTMDLDWISLDWVSGIFKFTEPWSLDERSLGFTYDRKLNRIISIEEIFDKTFDYKTFFNDYISWKKKEMMSMNTSNRFKAYMELEFFTPWTLRPEGFCFTSEWNFIWGTRKIIVPYALIQEHIKKSGPLRKLF
ncbi:MAG: hypothetical protein IPO78_14390 [Saprospiraceae bacterium]|nr:hypothetical protein [Saprospiraceae bacterium]